MINTIQQRTKVRMLFFVLWMVSIICIVQCHPEEHNDKTIVEDSFHIHHRPNYDAQPAAIPNIISQEQQMIHNMDRLERLERNVHLPFTSWDKKSVGFPIDTDSMIAHNDTTTMQLNQSLAHHHRELQNPLCVFNESGLRLALSNPLRVEIQLCTPYISIDARANNIYDYQGILIEDRDIDFKCALSGVCVLDARYLSRMFFVLRSSLYFEDIAFRNSNASKDNSYRSGGAFYIDDSSIRMVNCSFENNVANFGGGLSVFNSQLIITGSGNEIAQNNMASNDGGFLQAENSTIQLKGLNFFGNTGASLGGAILIFKSNLELLGSDSTMLPRDIRNNQARYGGFIYAENSVAVIKDYIFISNRAEYGGAFSLRNSTLTLSTSKQNTLMTCMESNSATGSGGLLEADFMSRITIINYDFNNNRADSDGGAIYLDNCVMTILVSDGNAVTSGIRNNAASDGGFIYARNASTINIYGDNDTLTGYDKTLATTIQNNTALDGGFISAFSNTTITIQACNFINNRAGNLGGAFNLADAKLTLLGSDIKALPSVIQNNAATEEGGFVDADNSVIEIRKYNFINNRAEYGGVMDLLNSVVKIFGSDAIQNFVLSNTASSLGGFAYTSRRSIIEINKYNFINNSANFGGGAFYISNSTLNLFGSDNDTLPSEIRNHKAATGGFIDAYNCPNITIRKYQTIKNNIASSGGVLSLSNSTLLMSGSNNDKVPNEVNNNTATADGGFIRARLSSSIEIQNYNIIGNNALSGGAIHILTSKLAINGNDTTRIENNRATLNGGFMSAYNDSIIDVRKHNFINNGAQNGGVFHIGKSILKVIGSDNIALPSKVQNNTASINGGFINADRNSIIYIQKYSFINNRAVNGGGFWIIDTTLTLLGNNTKMIVSFAETNAATEYGGFIYSFNNSIIIMNQIQFMKYNRAKYGGVFSITNSKLSIIGNDNITVRNEIYHNSATVDGGFLFANNNSMIDIREYYFSNNTAINGGGFLAEDSSLNLKGRDNPIVPTKFVIEDNDISIL